MRVHVCAYRPANACAARTRMTAGFEGRCHGLGSQDVHKMCTTRWVGDYRHGHVCGGQGSRTTHPKWFGEEGFSLVSAGLSHRTIQDPEHSIRGCIHRPAGLAAAPSPGPAGRGHRPGGSRSMRSTGTAHSRLTLTQAQGWPNSVYLITCISSLFLLQMYVKHSEWGEVWMAGW